MIFTIIQAVFLIGIGFCLGQMRCLRKMKKSMDRNGKLIEQLKSEKDPEKQKDIIKLIDGRLEVVREYLEQRF